MSAYWSWYHFHPGSGMEAWSGRLTDYIVVTVVGLVVGAILAWWFFK